MIDEEREREAIRKTVMCVSIVIHKNLNGRMNLRVRLGVRQPMVMVFVPMNNLRTLRKSPLLIVQVDVPGTTGVKGREL
jgi:hypothetical protein